MADQPIQHAEKVRVNYSVTCDTCGIVGAGLNKEQAKALKLRHLLSGMHNDGPGCTP